MKRTFSILSAVLIVVMAVSSAAWGQSQSNTLSPGAHQNQNVSNNTNTATGGAGGQGGVGIGGGADVDVRNTNTNVNALSNSNRQGQGQGQHQGQGQQQGQSQIGINKQGQAQGQVNQPNQTIEGDKVEVWAPAPGIAAPALAVAPETCMGSTSVGGSGSTGVVGFGLTVGSTWKSDDCELRMYARSLASLGQAGAALRLLAYNERVADALRDAGVKVPGLAPKAAAATPTTGVASAPAVYGSKDPTKVNCKSSEYKAQAANGEYFCTVGLNR